MGNGRKSGGKKAVRTTGKEPEGHPDLGGRTPPPNPTGSQGDKVPKTIFVFGDITAVHQRVIADRPTADTDVLGNLEAEIQTRLGSAYLVEAILASCGIDSFPRKWLTSTTWKFSNKPERKNHLPKCFHKVFGPSQWYHNGDGEDLSSAIEKLPSTQFDIRSLSRQEGVRDAHRSWRIMEDRTVTPTVPFSCRGLFNCPDGKILEMNVQSLPYKPTDAAPDKIQVSPNVLVLVVHGDGVFTQDVAASKNPSSQDPSSETFDLPIEALTRLEKQRPLVLKYKRGTTATKSNSKRRNSQIDEETKKLNKNLHDVLFHFRNNVVLINSDDLARLDNLVSRKRSWERLVQDTLAILHEAISAGYESHPLGFLKNSALVAVSFAPDAVLLVDVGLVCNNDATTLASNPTDKVCESPFTHAWLICDPSRIDGEFTSEFRGRTRAHESILASSLAVALSQIQEQEWPTCAGNNSGTAEPNPGRIHSVLLASLFGGLCASRYLQIRGFTPTIQSVTRKSVPEEAFGANEADSKSSPARWYLPKPSTVQLPGSASSRIPSLNYPLDIIGTLIRATFDIDTNGQNMLTSKCIQDTYARRVGQFVDEQLKSREMFDEDEIAPLQNVKDLLTAEESVPEELKSDEAQAAFWDLERSETGLGTSTFTPIARAYNELFQQFMLSNPDPGETDYRKKSLGDLIGVGDWNGEERGEVDQGQTRRANENEVKNELSAHLKKRIDRVLDRVIEDINMALAGVKILSVPEAGLIASNARRWPADVGPLSGRPHWYADNDWSFAEALRSEKSGDSESMLKVAQDVLELGARVLVQRDTPIPLLALKSYVSVDRWEIESIRELRGQVRAYFAKERPSRPLNVVVVGPPGAGKSYLVKSVIEDLKLDDRSEFITVNLSQLASVDDLFEALHRVRDVSIRGKVPIVFWDEYDSDFNGVPFGWLKLFLAPMQDGRFQEGQVEHPIGPAVFCFGGGRFNSVGEIVHSLEKNEPDSNVKHQAARQQIRKEPDLLEKANQLVKAKGKDFFSRVLCTLTVSGIDRDTDSQSGLQSHLYMIKRALILRSLLKRKFRQFQEIDEINVSTKVSQYLLRDVVLRHGSRSLEAIVDLCEIRDRANILVVDLPSETELFWHVRT